MLYLRTADFTMKKSCGIYEIAGKDGRKSYKIFADISELHTFLKKNKDKSCEKIRPIFETAEYSEHQNTEVRKLTSEEIKKYLEERLKLLRIMFAATHALIVSHAPKTLPGTTATLRFWTCPPQTAGTLSAVSFFHSLLYITHSALLRKSLSENRAYNF